MNNLVKLSDYYISTYANDKNQESQKNERKKVHNLIKKLEKLPDIFGGLAFDYITVEEQAKIVHFFLEECSQRQIVDNLTKVNVDADFSVFEKDLHMKAYLPSAVPNYNPLPVEEAINGIRNVIRATPNNLDELLHYLIEANDQVIRSYMKEYELHKAIGIKLDWIQYVTDYIDYTLNDVFQFLVYPIMMYSKKANSLEVIELLSNETDRLTTSFKNSISQNYNNIFGSEGLKASRILYYFRYFIEHRNRLFENSEIYHILIREMEKYPELFSDVPKQYKAGNILLTDEQIESDLYKTIFSEGIRVPNIDNKIAIARKLINVMQKYGGRYCVDSSLQDIKVYFREIFMSKETYHRQKTKKIVEDYLAHVDEFKEKNLPGLPDFQRQSQYIFLREKISRGYFREKNLSEAYAAKVLLTEKINTLLLKCYWLADSKTALNLIHDYNHELLMCYEDFLN